MAKRSKRTKVIIAPKKKKNELTRLGSALRALGGLGGGALGGLVGQGNLGSATGTSLGASLSRWLGSGDYSVSKNSLVSSMRASGSIPDMHRNDQTVTIRHKEFIGEIKSSTAFTVQKVLELNPGVSASFPWLSRLSGSYQQYSVKGMVYHYIPTSGNAVSSTNNALGSVMLQTTYRATDQAPTSKIEILNEYWATETVPSETMVHPIECDPKENPFNIHYVRNIPLTSSDEPMMYDLGKTYVCTSGQQADNIVLGDLWVTYEIEFKKPVVTSSVTANLLEYAATWNNPLGTAYFANSPDLVSGNTDIVTFSGNRTINIASTFAGYIYITLRFSSVTPWFLNPTLSGTPTLTGCTFSVLGTSAANDWETVNQVAGTSTTRNVYYTLAVIKSTNTNIATIDLLSLSTSVGSAVPLTLDLLMFMTPNDF